MKNGSFFKKLLCSHYFEDEPSLENYDRFISYPSLWRVGMKTVVCNKCGKLKHVDINYRDIKYIKG